MHLRAQRAMPGGFSENRFGKAVPIGEAAAGGMIGAGKIIAPAFAPDTRQNGGNGIGQIGRRSRAAPLIRHDAEFGALLPKRQHGAQKILAHGRENPSRAQHNTARIGRLRRPFPGKLGAAIGTNGIGRIAFQIRRAFQPIIHIISGNLDDRNARFARKLPQQGGAKRIGTKGARFIIFRRIHCRPGGAIHDRIGFQRVESCGYRFGLVEFKFRLANQQRIKTLRR